MRSARTKKRPATFVQATRSTSTTPPNTSQSSCETGPTIESWSDCTCGVSATALRLEASLPASTRARSACAAAVDTPRLRRAMPTRLNVRRLCRIAGQWKPQLDVIRGIREVLRHDAHDRARDVVHDHLPADSVRVAVKLLLPDAVRQHDDSIRARSVLARRERSPERRADAHDVEEVRRDPRAAHADGVLARLGSAEDAVVESPRGDTVERARVALVEHDAGVRLVHRRGAAVADGMREAHEAVRFREGQRLEQDAVHEAEHGRRRADAEGEHQDDRRGEAWGATKAARREPELRPGREHPGEV